MLIHVCYSEPIQERCPGDFCGASSVLFLCQCVQRFTVSHIFPKCIHCLIDIICVLMCHYFLITLSQSGNCHNVHELNYDQICVYLAEGFV